MREGSNGRRVLGRYELVRLIGEGAMAAVYEAVHTGLNKRVAVKALLPSVAALPGARLRFLREARAAARVRHPHVVDVTDVDEEGEVSFLVMELLEGETLAAYFARKGALALERAVGILLPVMAGVSAGHEAGVIHRDLKPQNVFLAKDFRGKRVPKVLDFGLSRLVDETTGVNVGERTGLRFGSSGYLSPEQANGSKGDQQSDQYVLGLLLYEAATGRRGHEGESLYDLILSATEARVTPAREHRPDLPPGFEAVLMRALSRDPAARFADLHAFGCALLPFASERTRHRWETTYGKA
jgi:serine/threonine-protein kinase